MGGGGDCDWVDLSAGVRAGAEEDNLGDGWGFEEFGAEGAGGVAGGFLG